MVITQLISLAAVVGVGYLGYQNLSNIKFLCKTIKDHYDNTTIKLGSYKAGSVCDKAQFKYQLLLGTFGIVMLVRIIGNYLGWMGYLVLLA